jgi:rhodanese-related sulfurtransferase
MAARHHDSVTRAALHAEVVASQEALAEMERQHEVAVAQIREAAQTEAARILAEARQHVARRSEPKNAPDTKSGNHAQ